MQKIATHQQTHQMQQTNIQTHIQILRTVRTIKQRIHQRTATIHLILQTNIVTRTNCYL